MNKVIYIFSFFLGLQPMITSQELTADELIKQSINYHDPKGELFCNNVIMDFTETRPNGEDRKSSISFNIKKERFGMTSHKDGKIIRSDISNGSIVSSIDGGESISEADRKKYRLSDDRIKMMKNYYQYLWLMPMKLTDSGTRIDQKVGKDNFFGKESLYIKVTYSAEVGKDIWYFYFHPTTYAMHGYRFYHDEAKNDGEYIILEDEITHRGVRLPKRRTWYTHAEDKLLGTDILERLSF